MMLYVVLEKIECFQATELTGRRAPELLCVGGCPLKCSPSLLKLQEAVPNVAERCFECMALGLWRSGRGRKAELGDSLECGALSSMSIKVGGRLDQSERSRLLDKACKSQRAFVYQ
jgi:hypothetical protein